MAPAFVSPGTQSNITKVAMNLKEKTVQSLTWAGTSQIMRFISQFVVTAILARLLAPGYFGLLAMATVFIRVLSMLNELGWRHALIQYQKVDERHYSSIFWINIVFSLLCTLLLVLATPLIAYFYGQPQIEPILYVLTLTFVIDSFVIVQRAMQMKALDFRRVAIIDMISFVCGSIVGIGLALSGYGIWSLVFQMIALKTVATILLWCSTSWKPKFFFSLTAVKDIFQFSIYYSGFTIVSCFKNNIDFLLIGKFLGPELLGYYILAFKLMMLPTRNISWVFRRVTFAAFSKIQNDKAKVRENYLKVIKTVALITFPIICGTFAIAPELVTVIVGPEWAPSIILIRIFCISGLLRSINFGWVTICLSQGRADFQLKFAVAELIIELCAIIIGLQWGLVGVVVSITLANIIVFPYFTAVGNRLIDLRMIAFIRVLSSGFLVGIALMSCLLVLKNLMDFSGLHQLIVLNLIGIVLYGGILWRCEQSFIKENFLKL